MRSQRHLGWFAFLAAVRQQYGKKRGVVISSIASHVLFQSKMSYLGSDFVKPPSGMSVAETMRVQVAQMLKGIDRYNPENLIQLEQYVQLQASENVYDLEANLAVLKLYQFNPLKFKNEVVVAVLLKALTNLPHTDFVLCKCLIDQEKVASNRNSRLIICPVQVPSRERVRFTNQ